MSMLKVYIAGSYSGRHRIKEEAAMLPRAVVLSKWFDDDFFIEKAWDSDFSGDVAEVMARVDRDQIRDADLVILDTIDKSSTGGSDTELGLALAYGKRVVHIGPYRNIFQTLVKEHYESWEEFYAKGRI